MTKNWEQELIAKAESRQALIGIVGLGYVGLPLAAEMAEAGFRVLGYDVTQRVVDTVNRGVSHVLDVPTERLARFVGREFEILVEEPVIGAEGEEELSLGRAWFQAPDVDGLTVLRGTFAPGSVVLARVVAVNGVDLEARVAPGAGRRS